MAPASEFLSTFPRRERLSRSFRSHTITHFYPRSHVGNDRCLPGGRSSASKFLSTFPRRERPAAGAVVGSEAQKFLSTFPRRERQSHGNAPSTFNLFLSTFPRRERRLRVKLGSERDGFLSTFPRRERPAGDAGGARLCLISIHVPT